MLLAPGIDQITGTWCVLSVASQREFLVADRLADQGLSHFLPAVKVKRIYRKRKVIADVPVYPNYLFGCFASDDERYALRATDYVMDMIPVHRTQQAKLVRQLHDLEAALSESPFAEVCDWEPGRLVRVIAGPMLGTTGKVIRRRNRSVLQVGVEMFGQCVTLDIDPACVKPL